MKHCKLLGFCLLISAFTAISVYANPQYLQLDDYLEQVKTKSPAVKSSNLQIDGSKESSSEGGLIYNPRFSFLGYYMNDKREVANALFSGSTSTSDNMTFALDQQFSFGTSAKLSYVLGSSQTSNINRGIVPSGSFNYSSGQTELDITHPLWKNGFGIETRATADLAEANSLASHYSESFKLKQTYSQAESTYYRLAIARESFKLQEDVLDRSKKILEWADTRVRNQLADKVDMLQAKAAYQARQLEIETAKNEQRSAQLAFNTLRYDSSDQVTEVLAPLNTENILKIEAPKKAEVTDDVKAAEQAERIAYSSNELSKQRAQPDLSLYGSLAYNGVDNYLSPAINDSFSTKNPMYRFGVQFSMPLFIGETSDIRSGRTKQQLATEANTLQTKLVNSQNWVDLEKRFSEAKGRLTLADELVKAQKNKLDHEKYRFNLGRTTTFQVLTYEQDYAQALITRLRIAQEILTTHAQMKAYSL